MDRYIVVIVDRVTGSVAGTPFSGPNAAETARQMAGRWDGEDFRAWVVALLPDGSVIGKG